MLGQWRQQVDAQRHQLKELAGYEQAYLEAAKKPEQSVFQLQANRQFLSQLDGVIGEQRARLKQIEHQFEQYCVQWRSLHQRRKLLEDYQARLDVAAQTALNKLWDKLCDELSGRAKVSNSDSA